MSYGSSRTRQYPGILVFATDNLSRGHLPGIKRNLLAFLSSTVKIICYSFFLFSCNNVIYQNNLICAHLHYSQLRTAGVKFRTTCCTRGSMQPLVELLNTIYWTNISVLSKVTLSEANRPGISSLPIGRARVTDVTADAIVRKLRNNSKYSFS